MYCLQNLIDIWSTKKKKLREQVNEQTVEIESRIIVRKKYTILRMSTQSHSIISLWFKEKKIILL